MKTRNGFVSNSSSSSFIVVCKKADWDAELEKLGPRKVLVTSVLGRPSTKKLYGQEVVFVSAVSSSEDRYSDIEDEEIADLLGREGDTYDLYEVGEPAIAEFLKAITKCGGIASESSC